MIILIIFRITYQLIQLCCTAQQSIFYVSVFYPVCNRKLIDFTLSVCYYQITELYVFVFLKGKMYNERKIQKIF